MANGNRKAEREFTTEYTNSASIFVHIDLWCQTIFLPFLSFFTAIWHKHTLTSLIKDAIAIVKAKCFHKIQIAELNAIQKKKTNKKNISFEVRKYSQFLCAIKSWLNDPGWQ